jgi:hypothetical protein
VKEYRLSEAAASRWVGALETLYREADRQIEALRATHPGSTLLNLRDFPKPAKDHFWDLVHVYDESNLLIAEHIAVAIAPVIERQRSRAAR